MIVCLCLRVSDNHIRQAVAQGIMDFDSLVLETGASSQCGACEPCARETFENAKSLCSSCPSVCARAQRGMAFKRLPADDTEGGAL